MSFELGTGRTKCFVELPEWLKRIETVYKPMMENRMNEIKAEQLSARIEHEGGLDRVRDVGIELAIQRYGLRVPSEDEEEDYEDMEDLKQPSTSRRSSVYESAPKRLKTEETTDDVLLSAIQTAIAGRGISTLHTR